MKKVLATIFCALMSVGMWAAEMNIFASGVAYQAKGNVMDLQYTLNAPATALALYQGDSKLADITDVALLTKGKHETSITLEAAIPAGAEYALKATAAPCTEMAEVTNDTTDAWHFGYPQGIAIDNNPTNVYFGRIYVSVSCDGDNTCTTAYTKSQKGGLFVFDGLLNELNTPDVGYHNTLVNAASRHYFRRVKVGPDGTIYVAHNIADETCIYSIAPANLSATPSQITHGDLTMINSFNIADDGTFFILDNANTTAGGGRVVTLKNSVCTELAAKNTTWGNADNDVVLDGRGGMWIAQNRWNLDAYSILTHVSGEGVIDFTATSSSDQAIKDLFTQAYNVSYRGTLAINSDKTILAFGGDKKVTLFLVSYDEVTGIPTLVKGLQTPTLGSNIDGIAFDAADNLYVLSASSERMYVFCTPKEDNSFITPVIARDKEGVIPVTGISINKHEITDLQVTFTETLSASITPDDATDKTFTWVSADETIATVAGGVITGIAPGQTKIYAISNADESIKDSCAVTVIAKIMHYPNIYAYGMKLIPANEQNKYAIDYMLNAPATQVTLILTDAEKAETRIALEGVAMGANHVEMDFAEMAAGTYTWAIEAEAEVAAPDWDEAVMSNIGDDYLNTLITPRGVTVNNNPASPFFGMIYVTETGNADAAKEGFYAYNPMLQGDNQLHTGAWGAALASPMRLMINPDDDLLYISDWSDVTPNIHIVDQAKLDEETLVFGGTTVSGGLYTNADGDSIHGSMSSCYVRGAGAERVLYTFDEDLTAANPMAMFQYNIGELATPWEAAPSAVVYNNAEKYEQNGNSVILPDAFGGWWISQDRAADGKDIPALIHIGAADTVDFNSNGLLGGRTRGAIAFNEDQTLCFSAGDNSIGVYVVDWDEDHIPTLTKDYTIPTKFGAQTSSTCYSLAVDRALNVYAIGNGQPLRVWATIPDEEVGNKCTTPGMGNIVVEAVTGLNDLHRPAVNVEKRLENGRVIIIRDHKKINLLGSNL